MRFLGYVFAKNRYINLKLGMPDIQASFYNIHSGFPKFQKFWVLEKLRKKNYFYFVVKKSFWEKPREPFERKFCSTSFDVFYLHFVSNFYFGNFKHLSIFDQKRHDIGSLKSV